MPNYAEALTFAKPIVLLGDMNCNLLENGYDRRALDDFSNCLNLSQLISEPTRITDTSNSLLDVILVTDKHLVVENGVVNVSISDHSLVFCTWNLKLPKPSPHYICVRSYKNYNPDLFSLSVSELALFDKVCDIDDKNLKLAMFDNAFLTNLNTYAPIKSVKIRNPSMAFVNKEIKDTMRTRDQLHKRFRLTRNIADWNSYRNARNDVKTKIKQAEFEYAQQEINRDKGNTGSMWKVIRKCLPSKLTTKPSYSKDINLVANEFNRFFTSVGPKAAYAASQLSPSGNNYISGSPASTHVSTYTENEQFNFKPVSSSELHKLIMSMPSNKAPGPLKISMRVIKDCLTLILPALTNVINCSLMNSTFPDAWKYAEVIPLPKEGNHEEPTNNRPLSLLPTVFKICEKVVLNQFSSYLTKNKRLNCHQSGNRKYHSTEHTHNRFIPRCNGPEKSYSPRLT